MPFVHSLPAFCHLGRKLEEKEEAEHQRSLKEIAERSKNVLETRVNLLKSPVAQKQESPSLSQALPSTSEVVELKSSLLPPQQEDKALVSEDMSRLQSQLPAQEVNDLTYRFGLQQH